MGLDMYLKKRIKNSDYDREEVAYWRKANQIRKWFENHLKNGVENCQYTKVTKENLLDLLNDCKAVLNNHDLASELLPTQNGFFFGNTEYNEYYFEQIESTVKQIKNILEWTDFETYEIEYLEWW